jgi:hypothetical protein
MEMMANNPPIIAKMSLRMDSVEDSDMDKTCCNRYFKFSIDLIVGFARPPKSYGVQLH